MEASTLLTTLVCSLLVYYIVQRYILIYYTLMDIPTAGAAGFFSTYAGIFKYLWKGPDIFEEGYLKYSSSLFKVYGPEGWIIVAGGRERLDDMNKASDDQLSSTDAGNRSILAEYTMGPEVVHDHYHIKVVSGPLTRSIAERFPDIKDEVIAASTDLIPLSDGWTKLPTFPTAMTIIVRTANRFFVGLPLCRNEDYLKIIVNHTMEVIVASYILRLFPGFLRPLASKIFTQTDTTYNRIRKHLKPLLQDRLDQDKEYGKHWKGRSNDSISWLLDLAEGSQRSIRDLTLRVLVLNFSTTHTSTMTLTHALHDLASNSQLIDPLREEIEGITRQQGWTKDSVGQMYKLDSFLKESQRFWGIGAVLSRLTHFNEAYYSNPKEFQPFRFLHERPEGDRSVSQLLTTTGPSWIAFGFGRHACPGRFFASNEIKLAMAHILLTYDIKLDSGADQPQNKFIGMHRLTDTRCKLLWRKRHAVAA